MKPFSDRPHQSDKDLPNVFGGSVLHTIMDAGVLPQLLLTEALQVIYPNKTFCGLAGCSLEEAEGVFLETFQQGKWHLLPNGWVPKAGQQTKDRLTAPGEVIRHDYPFQWKHIHETAGGATYLLLTITSAEAAPSSHNATRAQMLADPMLEASPDCLQVLDPDGRLLAMNTSGKR